MRIVNGPRASSARFELTAKWIAPRLSAGGRRFERLETAAHALRKIPNTAGKIDIKKANTQGWRTDFVIASHYLNSVSAAGPVQIPSSLLFFEFSGYYVNMLSYMSTLQTSWSGAA
jgi:hypothetical protein